MYAKKIVSFSVAVLAAALLWGCGSNGSGGSSVTPRTGPDVLESEASCIGCHAPGGQYPAHIAEAQTWTSGTNVDLVGVVDNVYKILHSCQDCHGGGSAHSGTRGSLPHPRPTADVCAQCHEQVDRVLAWGNHLVSDNVGNKIPACAACHDVLGLDNQDCMSCHDTTEDLLAVPQIIPVVSADDSPISAKVTASMHNFGGGRTGDNCQRCHTVDGFLNLIGKGIDPTKDANYNDTTVDPPVINAIVARALAPTCAACHEPHTGDLRAVPGWDPNNNNMADQFDLCTACHNYSDNDGNILAEISHHDTNWYRNILSTHYDDPATGYGLTDNIIEGYVIRTNSAKPCFDCHGHELRTNTRRHLDDPASRTDGTAGPTIHTDWANSRHGGELLGAKVAAAAAAGSTVADIRAAGRADGEGHGWSWTHYDWDAQNRQSCARCHTSTGVANYLDDPVNYDPANNDFSHLEGWENNAGTITSSGQNELLYCWGCHSNTGTGELRDPGAITEVYAGSPTGSPAVTVSYPDSGKSNVCMGCHLGREVGGVIAASTGDFTNLSFINSHYLAAGGMIYGEAGYEFAGEDYTGWEDGEKYGRHGNVARDEFGSDGPCVTCHMTSAAPHKFEVVQKDDAGAITAVATTACDSCHGNMSAAWLEGRKATFHEALEALNQALLANGIEFKAAYPYFYVAGTTTAFKNWDGVSSGKGKDVMGAAFNYNLLEHDPGAYAHNANYALKLVVDSIDFLADGMIDGIGTFTINAESVDLLATANAALAYTIEEKHHGGEVLVQANYTTDTTVYNVGCGDCHAANPDPDGSRFVTNGLIIDQFAESAHGDVLGEAWMHYDWRAASRASCQRCHTATGFVERLGDEANTTNLFDAADEGLPGEVLRCTGCHTDIATGAVRTASAFTATYSNDTTQAFPDVSVSNLCVRCHSGRENGDSIKNDTDDDGVRSFLNSHYLTAGAIVFATGGYQYDGKDYAFAANDRHQNIGYGATVPTGDDNFDALSDDYTSGPCVTCHFNSADEYGQDRSHTLSPFTDTLADGTVLNDVCVVCHTSRGVGDAANAWYGKDFTASDFVADVVAPHKGRMLGAQLALQAVLASKGILTDFSAYPYFFADSGFGGGSADNGILEAGEADRNNGFTNWAGIYGVGEWKNVMGAAFNLNLVAHDPGATAHNRRYARRLIYDAIDFMDDGIMNDSTSATVTAQAAAYTASALNYIGSRP